MCGFLGIAVAGGVRPFVEGDAFCALRDEMTHRGPDDAGYYADNLIQLGHRRLSVIDPTPDGRQPMATAPDVDGRSRFQIVYNGELYNDRELRRDLEARGVVFRTKCDTETLLMAFATWGSEAFIRARGMISAAFYDAKLRTITLVRDPMGIKPLYYAIVDGELVFASEAHVVAAHPTIDRRPDWAMVSAYTSTIRTVLGERTMYRGVRSLRAGQMLQCDLSGDRPIARLVDWWSSVKAQQEGSRTLEQAAESVRETVGDSVRRHLRSDVPLCSLLSGGLDSTIISALTNSSHDALRTYSAGHESGEDSDLAHARRVAEHLGTDHAEAIVDESFFRTTWRSMVERQRLPLSTPNEVAIHAVSSCLRADGCVVTLSGEGADELFGGYEQPLALSSRYVRGELDAPGPGTFELMTNAWLPLEAKPEVLRPEVWDAAEHDAWLTAFYESEFEAIRAESGVGQGADPLQAHLRFLRRVNLVGLLQRLDTASMLASVEGRTPFADVSVAMLAEALPMGLKFDPEGDPPASTKRVLREAFRPIVPEHVMHRHKASFPLPFIEWMDGHEELLRSSELLRRVFVPEVIETLVAQPREAWNVAWPALNLAMWGGSITLD